MDPRLEHICRIDGVFLRREAVALGYDDPTMSRLIRAGEWVRVRRGAYVSGAAWCRADEAERYRLRVYAAAKQAKTEVVPSHTSAVAIHGGPLWGLSLRESHLTRRDRRTGRSDAGVVQHRGVLADQDVVEVDGRPVMSPTRAVIETASISPVAVTLCVANDFLHRELTTPTQLEEKRKQMYRWPGALPTDLTLRLADGRFESVGESRFSYICFHQHLPAPTPQFEIYDDDGNFLGRVDFAWPELGLFGEFDGRIKYHRYRREGESIEDAVLREKRREELICEYTGWRCIRIIWSDLAHPEQLAARVRRLIDSQAHFVRRAS